MGTSSPYGKYIHESFYTKMCMFSSPKCLIFHLPFVCLREVGENWWIYVTVGGGSSLVLRSVTEEGGGYRKQQNWPYITGE